MYRKLYDFETVPLPNVLTDDAELHCVKEERVRAVLTLGESGENESCMTWTASHIRARCDFRAA